MIGSETQIGANAVVMTDVPEGSIVMPPECRTITKVRGAAPAARPGSGAIRERVMQMLQETVCRGRKIPPDDSLSLLENGLIDSLGILMLADEIKARFHCAVANEELAPENLDSVLAITSFLLRKGASEN